MVQHIYGTTSVLAHSERPNVFINELKMYVDYLKKEMEDVTNESASAQIKKLQSFKNNLLDGIAYYVRMFTATNYFKTDFVKIQNQLHEYQKQVVGIEIPELTEMLF